jgi:uncharacterized protein YjiS (DUF1127 family)
MTLRDKLYFQNIDVDRANYRCFEIVCSEASTGRLVNLVQLVIMQIVTSSPPQPPSWHHTRRAKAALEDMSSDSGMAL